MERKQRQQFEEALEKKAAEAAEREQRGKALAGTPEGDAGVDPDSQGLTDSDREQDVMSAREKNSRHGKMTADKWNQ